MERQHGKAIPRNENEPQIKENRKLPWFLTAAFVFLIIFSLYFALIPSIDLPGDGGWSIRGLTLLGVLLILGAVFLRYKQNRLDTPFVLFAILVLGLVIKTGYAFATPITTRQHDVGWLTYEATGHFGYILRIFSTWTLPTSNAYQFYHPPLFHFSSAVWLKFTSLLVGSSDLTDLMGTVRILTVFYSYCTLLTVYRLLKEIKAPPTVAIVTLLLMAVHPSQTLLAGRINNDGLSTLFLFLSLLYTIKWLRKPGWVNTIILAITIGAGMMSKLSAAIIAPVVAGFFIYGLVKTINTKKFWPLVLRFFVFALIVFPLGLWYPIRNLIEFDQPLIFVWEITNPVLSTEQFTLWQRFGFPEFSRFFTGFFAWPGNDYNIWQYLLRTSVFGEFSYWGSLGIALLLLLTNLFMMLEAIFSIFYSWFQKQNRLSPIHYLLQGLLIFLFVAYISFNLSLPYGPTMDFRYLLPTVLVASYYLSLFIDMKRIKPVGIVAKNVFVTTVATFCVLSILSMILLF